MLHVLSLALSPTRLPKILTFIDANHPLLPMRVIHQFEKGCVALQTYRLAVSCMSTGIATEAEEEDEEIGREADRRRHTERERAHASSVAGRVRGIKLLRHRTRTH